MREGSDCSIWIWLLPFKNESNVREEEWLFDPIKIGKCKPGTFVSTWIQFTSISIIVLSVDEEYTCNPIEWNKQYNNSYSFDWIRLIPIPARVIEMKEDASDEELVSELTENRASSCCLSYEL